MEINSRKKPQTSQYLETQNQEEVEFEDDSLALCLSLPSTKLTVPRRLPPPPPRPPAPVYVPPFHAVAGAASSSSMPPSPQNPATQNQRSRSTHYQAPRGRKDECIPAPFEWATNHRATVHSLDYLLSNGIRTISGEVQCKRCEARYFIEFDLQPKFLEIGSFISANKSTMHDRAPKQWMSPPLLDCQVCRQTQCVKPGISPKKRSINWLFLLLGQMLGCCTLEQLKYFCKHTKNHRTGAKDRVLYLTYLGLCKQLDSTGPFDR